MRRGHLKAHRAIWLVLAVVLPAIILLSLTMRTTGPTEGPQILLTPPK